MSLHALQPICYLNELDLTREARQTAVFSVIQLNKKIKSTSFFAGIKSTFCYYINNRSLFIVKKLIYITYYTYYIIIDSKHHERASHRFGIKSYVLAKNHYLPNLNN
jgi:hypothetical protein